MSASLGVHRAARPMLAWLLSARHTVMVSRVAVLLLAAIALVGCGASRQSLSLVLGAPGCSTVASPGAPLGGARTAMEPISREPFGVVTTADGRWSFVSSPGQGVTVLSDAGFLPRVVRLVRLPAAVEALGATLTHSGRYLLIADRSGTAVLSVARLEQGAARPLLGVMLARGRVGGAIEVITSPDDRFAFVTLEGSRAIAVFDLRRAIRSRFRSFGFIGEVPTGLAPVGMAVAPSGRWLYVTSELQAGARTPPFDRRREPPGTLSVIDLQRAESDPAHSTVATVRAGCEPVRVAVAPDGSVVWVTARASDRLLGFAADRLTGRDPAHALTANVPVGAAPVDLTQLAKLN